MSNAFNNSKSSRTQFIISTVIAAVAFLYAEPGHEYYQQAAYFFGYREMGEPLGRPNISDYIGGVPWIITSTAIWLTSFSISILYAIQSRAFRNCSFVLFRMALLLTIGRLYDYCFEGTSFSGVVVTCISALVAASDILHLKMSQSLLLSEQEQ